MTNILDGLLGRIDDPALRDALAAEVDRLRDTKDFGLVFERHLPENVRLYSHPVRRSCKVQDRATNDDTTWRVRRITDGQATLVGTDGEETTRPTDELVVIRQFGDPIHPGFTRVASVERGGGKPFHTVINGENYHTLETLLYTCEGQVDCVYLDPPYNTGARDWKYDNDYVDKEDSFRHSKWLAFMERRLQLVKSLLNPDDSVLIVTIDEKEYLRLGMLLEQVFPEARMQMVTSVTNTKGVSRAHEFSRVEEYIFFVYLGAAEPATSPDNMLTESTDSSPPETAWLSMRRSGTAARRSDRPNQFYPIFVDEELAAIHSVGSALLPASKDRTSVKAPAGTVAVWPLRADGSEGRWQLSADSFREALASGTARLGRKDKKTNRWAINYLSSGSKKRIKDGAIPVIGTDDNGALVLDLQNQTERGRTARTVWNRLSHDASTHGSSLLRTLIPGRMFPFPKSLYAVEDTIRFFVKNKPDALILDFFGGSGTTTHAVARLNHQDDGRRRSIVVTNNEVSDDEAKVLRKAGHQPGDPEWEAQGIFEHVTMPRVVAAITGRTPEGAHIVGNYRFVDEFPMADGFKENVEFLELAYLDRNDVSRGKAFEAIAPLLWLKVGAVGEMVAKVKKPYAAPEGARYAVLFDVAHWQDFAEAVRDREDITHLFVVTDSIAQYQQVVAELPPTVEVAMLYEDYLRNFEINLGGAQ
jgi:adenine-specific DNA-methyltransferase